MTLRRNRIDLCTPAENAIRAAIDAVEVMGADERLTYAVNLLGMAREKVADFVDGIAHNQGWKRDIILGRADGECVGTKES